MSYDGRAVANFVLDVCEQRQRPITNLALQKIVYFCHAWTLIDFGHPLVKHKFEAWEYGPVLPYLYRAFKEFDRSAITTRANAIEPVTGSLQRVSYDFDAETSSFITKIVDFYSRMRAGDLVELSHAEGGPWHRVWYHDGQVNPGMRIENDSISDFYSKARRPFLVQ